jgi:hypothetical protein
VLDSGGRSERLFQHAAGELAVMGYEPNSEILKLLYYWQTLAAGFLAVVAAAGTIWATISSANREITASKSQTAVAQEQVATALRLEKRRVAREGYAFCAMIEATMGRVLAEADKGKEISTRTSQSTGTSTIAYEARQCFSKAGFLDLESEIDSFASKWELTPTAGDPLRKGAHTGLLEELNVIKIKANHLRNESSAAMKRATTLLAETEVHHS